MQTNGYRGWDSLPLPVGGTFDRRTVGVRGTEGYLISRPASTEKVAKYIAIGGLVAVLGVAALLLRK